MGVTRRVLEAGVWVLGFAALRWLTPPYLPFCGFRKLTGVPCPLCGMTRALFALAKGEWSEAIELHALSPLIFGLLAAFGMAALVRLVRPSFGWRTPAAVWNGLLCLLLAYGMVRIFTGVPVHADTQEEKTAPLKPLTVGVELRGRFEAFTGRNFTSGENDAYYLHRVRLTLGVQPTRWLRFVFQTQDARAPGHRDPKPSSLEDPFDLKLGYVELGRDAKSGWLARAGRQELAFGEERLVGASNWGNAARSFDGVRVSWAGPGKKLDWFVTSVVVPDRDRFDRSDWSHRFSGFYSSFTDVVPQAQIEPYVLWRSDAGYRNELQQIGRLDVVTTGVRAVGKLPARFDYGTETAFQTGRAAGTPMAAWAGHFGVGYTVAEAKRAPRLWGQFNLASGDKNPGDGRVNTFDNLYPTNHSLYGIVDRMGWRNMREVAGGIEWSPWEKWRFGTDYHTFWLATLEDSLYFDNGSAFVRNPNASSRRVQDEIDVTATYQPNGHFSLLGGYAHLFPRTFLKESTPGSAVSGPYVMWLWRF